MSGIDRSRMAGPDRARKGGSGRRRWNLGYFIREGFTSIFRHGLMSFAAVCTTVACLLIMGSFALVAVDLDANLVELERDNEFLAYIDDSLSDDQAYDLIHAITAVDNVREVQFVDREEVLSDFRAQREGENELYDLLPEDTFQHRYRIHVDDIAILGQTVEQVRNIPGIESTSADLNIAEGMIAVRNVAAGLALILIAMLAIVSLFIISNTLRLATFYRREEIAIMRMCGATNSFICWPFVMEGAILGLSSAILAFFLQWWIYGMIANTMGAGGQLSFLVAVPFAQLWKLVLLVFCGAGLVIGVLGSLLGIRKFLKV